MTGCGTAVDAASRGLSVALVEAGDFAEGTSSRSSKMVHGGLRYLQQREFRLVYENLHERQRLLENAPHLVRPLPFLIPLFGSDGVVSRAVARSYKSALWLYDLTGGIRIGKRHREISRDEVVRHFPTLDVSSLVAGFLYYDARGDDARVALCLARSAADLGAVVVNHSPAISLRRDSLGRVTGAVVRPLADDGSPGAEIEVSARVVVNAAGVFVDEVGSLGASTPLDSLTPAKGVHLTVPADRLPCDVAAVIPVPEDHRSIFVVPWEEGPFVYLGTTDTAYAGDLHDPLCRPEDVEYLLGAVNRLTSADLRPEDVTAVWAGLRPLLKPRAGRRLSARTADLSRRHKVETGPDGMVTITGGKWTTYRKMAEDAGDEIARQLPGTGRSRTRRLALHGAKGSDVELDPLGEELARHLRRRYGADAATLAAMIAEDPADADVIVEGLPYVLAEVRYAARHEMALSLSDVLSRRTRSQLQDARATRRAAPAVGAVLAEELGWDDARLAGELASFDKAIADELAAAGLSEQQLEHR